MVKLLDGGPVIPQRGVDVAHRDVGHLLRDVVRDQRLVDRILAVLVQRRDDLLTGLSDLRLALERIPFWALWKANPSIGSNGTSALTALRIGGSGNGVPTERPQKSASRTCLTLDSGISA